MFCKNNNPINCDDIDNAICFLILGHLLLLGSPWNKILLEVLEWSICVAAQPISTKVLISKKTEDESAYCPDRNRLLQIIKTMQKFSLFSKDSKIV